MTATPRLVRRLREESRLRIDEELERLILERFGTEPIPYTYSEQDLWEQIRKLVAHYNEELPSAHGSGAACPTGRSEGRLPREI
jgi:hypothetical protein